MKHFLTILISIVLSQSALAQCTTTDASDCDCADGTSNCLLLPDITASWQGISDNGWIEYPQTGAGENFNQGPDDGRLRVTGSTPNIGYGSFTVRGQDSDGNMAFICGNDTIYNVSASGGSFSCPNGEENPKQMLLQRVYKKDGNTMSYEDTWTGSMTYHESHGHNHVDDWAVMTLRIPTTDPNPLNWPIVGDGAKIGFCLMDYGQCGTTAGSTYYGHCRDDNTTYQGGNIMTNPNFSNWNLGGGSYGCSVVEQGISSGWTDVYGYWLDGMWINVPENTCNGDYYIVMEVDKNNYFEEENEDNNYTAVPVTLTMQHPANSGILPTISSNESNNLCSGQSITLTATAGTEFLWSTGETTQSITISSPGSYTCAVTNFCGTNTSLPYEVYNVIPSAPVVSDTSACVGTYLGLEATSSGSVEWFDDNGNFLGNGNYYVTNPLIENTTLWLQNTDFYTQTVNAEPYTNGIGGGGYLSSAQGSVFHAYTPFTLKSVLVYAEEGGDVTVELQDESGAVLHTTTASVPAGASRIEMEFAVPMGYDYQLVGTNLPSGGLYRNNNSATYPYDLDDILSIVGATSQSSYFYYFYDWEIETENGTCTSALVPVEITVPDPQAPEANGVTICTNQVAQLSATGSGVINWFDENGVFLASGSNYSTPELTASALYYVQSSENGCNGTSTAVEVIVESCANLSEITIESTISITPNPSNGSFEVTYGITEKEKVEIEITDATGKRIYKRKFQDHNGMNAHKISLENFADGMYTLQLKTGSEIHSERLILKND